MFEQFYDIKPQLHYLPAFDMKADTEWYGIKGFWFEGAPYQGKKTKVFGLIGYPEIQEGIKAPAMVLVHGGGGHPFAEWIRKWNERGYVAIAIDTTGYFPAKEFRGVVGTERAGDGDKFTHELYGELIEDGYTVGPDNGGMRDFDLPMEEQWMYHAVTDTILAHNILLNDLAVDNEKIGITGISWGGVTTSIAIGYDNRYAFAIPIYGSGHLDYLPAPELAQVFGIEAVKKNWSAADRFAQVPYPVYWLCFDEDTAFSFGANSLSYLDTKEKGACFSIKRGMGHSHIDGWNAEEGYRFADEVLKGNLPFARPIDEPEGFGEIAFKVEAPSDYENLSAEAFYITETISYDEKNKLENTFCSVPLTIENGIVKGKIPDEACGYFMEFQGMVGDKTYISTSSWVVK